MGGRVEGGHGDVGDVVMEAELSAGIEMWWRGDGGGVDGGHGVVGGVVIEAELKAGMEMWVV